MAFREKDVVFYGFTPVPRDPDVLFKDHPTASGENPKQDLFESKDILLPDSPLVQKVKAFVKVCSLTLLSQTTNLLVYTNTGKVK